MPVIASEPRTKTLWAWTTGSFFGIGLVGKGGGTVASAVTAAIWLLAARTPGLEIFPYASLTLIAAIVATVMGILASGIMARELGKKDPAEVVVDEVAGQLIALIAIPIHWKSALVALILFRVFDIVKPPPVRNLEALPRGWGIMMDDVAAGFYALVVMQVLVRLQVF
jgi:phosphatidylglycerophosphatase A